MNAKMYKTLTSWIWRVSAEIACPNGYLAAAEERGQTLDYEQAREIVYGMPYPKWKEKYQAEATSAQKKAFEQNIEK